MISVSSHAYQGRYHYVHSLLKSWMNSGFHLPDWIIIYLLRHKTSTEKLNESMRYNITLTLLYNITFYLSYDEKQ